MFKSVRIINRKGKMFLSFKQDVNVSHICTKEKTQLGGGKFYFSIFSDGSVSCGHYDDKGRWKFVEPSVINDIFNLTTQPLWEYPVAINGRRACIMQEVFLKLNEEYNLEEELQKLIASGEREKLISF